MEATDSTETMAREAMVMNLLREQLFVCMDISQSADILGEVCRRAGISVEEVAAVLTSPPCETYSVADATNQTRGNHYRDHKDEGKPPRSLESCHTEAEFQKREKAIKHDLMVQQLIQGLITRKQQGGEFEIVMENPVGSLAKQDCIKSGPWTDITVQQKVDYCAYGKKYRKATNIWTTLKNWEPKGVTGNGRCGWKCGQWCEVGTHCSERTDEVTTRIGRQHKQAIGAEPSRLPRGPQQRQKIWSIPEMLQQEILDAMPENTSGAKYMVDLFSGGESWRRQVEAKGYIYIGVDLRRATGSAKSSKEGSPEGEEGELLWRAPAP